MQEVRGSIPGRGVTDFCTLILFVYNFLYRAVICFLSLFLILLSIILENNNFSFNDSFFNQRKGCTMGAKVSPTYATLVLGYLEELMYERITIEKGHNFGQYIMENWKRFLDDCFSIWPFSGQDLNYFENVLNSLHKDIQFKPLIKST